MNDSDVKPIIKLLTETSDYSLWEVRVEVACEELGCEEALGKSFESDKCDLMKKKRQKASGVIVRALSDTPLRIVQSVGCSPVEMLDELDARYASKMAASKITNMTDLITINHTSLQSDISKHIDLKTAKVEHLRSMNATI